MSRNIGDNVQSHRKPPLGLRVANDKAEGLRTRTAQGNNAATSLSNEAFGPLPRMPHYFFGAALAKRSPPVPAEQHLFRSTLSNSKDLGRNRCTKVHL